MDQTKFMKRVESLMKKTRQLSTLCGVDACIVVFASDSPTPKVWPDGDQSWKAEETARRYLRLDSNNRTRQKPDRCQEFNDLAEEQGLRNLARVLAGKIEAVKRKMERRARRQAMIKKRKARASGVHDQKLKKTRGRRPATEGAMQVNCPAASIAGTGHMDNSCSSTAAMLCSGESISTDDQPPALSYTAMLNEALLLCHQ